MAISQLGFSSVGYHVRRLADIAQHASQQHVELLDLILHQLSTHAKVSGPNG